MEPVLPTSTTALPNFQARSSTIQPYSCMRCKARKIKCEKIHPCSNCQKSRTECVFRAPPPPRRKKRSEKLREMDLQTRLRRYEGLLRGMGVRIDEIDGGGFGDDQTREMKMSGDERVYQKAGHEAAEMISHTGKMISNEGKSRYLENNLWASLSDELYDTNEILEDSSDEDEGTEEVIETPSIGLSPESGDLILGSHSPNIKLLALHPPPVQIFKLWQTFLENVNPLTKIIHTPTVQMEFFNASSGVEHVSKSFEAFMFAVYSVTVTSMSDADCESALKEKKVVLQAKYQYATKQALLKADFLKTSDLMVLQAYVLFLLSIRSSYDPRALWSLTGIALRIGQRVGLHRDGTLLSLSPFQTEINRRIWWQILVLDGRTAELAGSGFSIMLNLTDTKPPLNVNDSELYPSMKNPPQEHAGVTEMVFALLRAEVGRLLQNSAFPNAFDGIWQSLDDSRTQLAEKDKVINELEEMIKRKYVRHLDPDIPLHALCNVVASSTICRLRLYAHHPRQYSARGLQIPQKERDMLFQESLWWAGCDNLGQQDPRFQKYVWHIENHFQWHPFIYLLSELRCRFEGPDVEKAWDEVAGVFRNRRDMLSKKKPLHTAIANLTLKAYEARQAYFNRQKGPQPSEGGAPEFITTLYNKIGRGRPYGRTGAMPEKVNVDVDMSGLDLHERRGGPGSPTASNAGYGPALSYTPPPQGSEDRSELGIENVAGDFDSFLWTDPSAADPSTINWNEWDNLMAGFEWLEDGNGIASAY